jgi:hypothetical protein
VGDSGENVAVVAMQARRSYERPEQASVFATLANFAPAAAACDVQLSLNGNVRSVRSVTVPARRRGGDGAPLPGKVSVSFSLAHAGGAVVEVRQLREDVLRGDDAAWAILPPPKRLSVLLVTVGNPALKAALKACPLAKLDIRTPADFDAMDHAAMTVEQPYDVIVLDNHVPASRPRGRYLVFGRPPRGIGLAARGTLRNQTIVDWRSQHSVLQFLNMSRLFVLEGRRLVRSEESGEGALPAATEVLAEFAGGPALVLARAAGSTYLVAGFDVMNTNWPFQPAFVMFCYNATNFLGMEIAQARRGELSVGQAISLEALPAGATAQVSLPGGRTAEVAADANGALRFPATHRAGVYTVEVAGREPVTFAVNLLDADESDVAPADELILGAGRVAAQTAAPARANVELWPLLALVALLLACLEWFVYNSRVRL